MGAYKHDWLKSYEHVQEAGRKFGAEHPGLRRGRDRQGAAGGHRHHLVHLRHDRQSQGRDDLPRQCHRRGRELCTGVAAQARGHVAGLSADGVGGRLGLHALREPHRGVLRQLSREPGDGAAGPARAGPLDAPGSAQDLGEHAHLGPGARRRRLAAQAPDLRVLPLGGRARRDPARRRQARPRGTASGHRRSASSSSTGPSGTSSVSDRPSGRSPAGRRSGPTPSGSSARSA